jgi:DNA-3-methyladenine glycosylase II
MYFEYGQEVMDYLTERDPVLGEAIREIGPIQRKVMPDLFKGLVRNIIGQQIASKAAATVWDRFQNHVEEVIPEKVAKLELEEIQQLGMSMRKATYIHGIAKEIDRGELDLKELSKLPDEAVVKALQSLPGIGIWTAEMLMIFSMQRLDVLSWGDLGIKRGMMRLYGLETLDRKTFEFYRSLYSPYGSVAALYLWELSAD